MNHLFQPGDRVTLPTGQAGTIQPPPWFMPLHALVQLDDGKLYWYLTEILQPIALITPMAVSKRSSKRVAVARSK